MKEITFDMNRKDDIFTDQRQQPVKRDFHDPLKSASNEAINRRKIYHIMLLTKLAILKINILETKGICWCENLVLQLNGYLSWNGMYFRTRGAHKIRALPKLD